MFVLMLMLMPVLVVMFMLSGLLLSFVDLVVVVIMVAMVAVRPLGLHVVIVPEGESGSAVADIDPPGRDLAHSAAKRRVIRSHLVAGGQDHVVAVGSVTFALAAVEARGQSLALAVSSAAVTLTERKRERTPGEVAADGTEADKGQRNGLGQLGRIDRVLFVRFDGGELRFRKLRLGDGLGLPFGDGCGFGFGSLARQK